MFKKKILLPILIFVCCVAATLGVVAATRSGDDDGTVGTAGLQYAQTSDGEAYVCTGIGNAATTDIVIPGTYRGKPVIAIDNGAFYNSVSLTSVTIGEGVSMIYPYAFRGCVRLTTVNLPDSLWLIDNRAFEHCTSLTEINIATSGGVITEEDEEDPAKTLMIQESAFKGCTSLTSVVLPPDCTLLLPRTFDGCDALAELTVPATMQGIDEWALAGCSALKTIHYGGTVAQWEELPCAPGWDTEVTGCTVKCTDGEILLD